MKWLIIVELVIVAGFLTYMFPGNVLLTTPIAFLYGLVRGVFLAKL